MNDYALHSPAQAMGLSVEPGCGGFRTLNTVVRWALQHARQDLPLQCGKTHVAGLAWTRNVNALVQRDAPVLNQNDAVRQRHGFLNVVCDQQRGEAAVQPQVLNHLVHFNAGQRVQCAQRLAQQQQAWVVNQRARQRHALPLSA